MKRSSSILARLALRKPPAPVQGKGISGPKSTLPPVVVTTKKLSLKLKPKPAAAQPRPPSPAKAAWLKGRSEAMAALIATYPQAFDVLTPRPLAIGVGAEIMSSPTFAAVEPRCLQAALRYWARGVRYLVATSRDGSVRIGLDGVGVAPVSDEDRAWARQRLDQMRERRRSP